VDLVPPHLIAVRVLAIINVCSNCLGEVYGLRDYCYKRPVKKKKRVAWLLEVLIVVPLVLNLVVGIRYQIFIVVAVMWSIV